MKPSDRIKSLRKGTNIVFENGHEGRHVAHEQWIEAILDYLDEQDGEQEKLAVRHHNVTTLMKDCHVWLNEHGVPPGPLLERISVMADNLIFVGAEKLEAAEKRVKEAEAETTRVGRKLVATESDLRLTKKHRDFLLEKSDTLEEQVQKLTAELEEARKLADNWDD